LERKLDKRKLPCNQEERQNETINRSYKITFYKHCSIHKPWTKLNEHEKIERREVVTHWDSYRMSVFLENV